MSMLEGRAAADAGGARSISVKAKLRYAFMGIAAFSLLAAIVGIVSYEAVDVAQKDIIEQAIPAAREVERLVQEAETVSDIISALLAASDRDAVALQRKRIEDVESKMRSQLPHLPNVESIDARASRFEKTIDGIFAVLLEQAALVEKRIATADHRNFQASRALAFSRKVIEALRPAIIESTTVVFSQTDRIRSQLNSNALRNVEITKQFDQLMDVDVQNVQRLTGIRDRIGNLTDEIEALALSRNPESVTNIRNRLNIHLRAVGRMAQETKDPDLRLALGVQLKGIAKSIRGPNNLIERHVAYLGIVSELDALTTKSRNLRVRLGLFATELKQAVDVTIAASTLRAENAIWYGRISLSVIAILAFLSAVYVIWRFVLTDVAARLDRIAAITRRLADGDVDVAINVQGTDELGDVADAMRHFKANAIELRRSNADLEQFAYVASHDLKAPLRGIANLANWIEEDIGETMPGDSKKHLNLLKSRIGRLSALLEDLLQYSRAGRTKSQIRNMDLSAELPELFKLVAANDKFELELPSAMPILNTAAAPLEQIFRNLFSNVIKHHDHDHGRITVTSIDMKDRYEFVVADDGPGIPQEYHERIFGMFQTIRARDEVEGSGIGLSIGKKLVESVGCRVWVDSNPSLKRGAAIHFTWPVKWPKALIESS